MPDKPTDKKLTFVEWFAREGQASVADAKTVIESYGNFLLDAKHSIDCKKGCPLCTLDQWLSEYKKYFKQK